MVVPQVVDPARKIGLLEDLPAGTGEVGRPPRFTVGAGEDEVASVEAGIHAKARLALRLAVLAQRLDGDRRQGELRQGERPPDGATPLSMWMSR